MSEITTSKGIAKAGNILNVPVIMIINVPKFGEDISITAKMVDVETGCILWMGSGSGTTGKTLSTIVGAAAGAVAGAAASGEDDAALGGIAGGVIGGAAGNLLSPDQAKKSQEIIGKIAENLPLRCR